MIEEECLKGYQEFRLWIKPSFAERRREGRPN